MKNIIAFAGSNSSTSINHQLVTNVSKIIENHSIKIIKLTDFPLPMYGEDLERAEGFPDPLQQLLTEIKSADGLLISVNEHNGTVSAYFKNVLDWLSRIEYKFLDDKSTLVLSTSPGKRGAISAMEYTASVLPRFGAKQVFSMAFPSFSENVIEGEIINETLKVELHQQLTAFQSSL